MKNNSPGRGAGLVGEDGLVGLVGELGDVGDVGEDGDVGENGSWLGEWRARSGGMLEL